MRSRSRSIQQSSKVCAVWGSSAVTQPLNSLRIGLSSASWPRVMGPSNMPPAMPKNFHQSWRIFSRFSGRKGCTSNPALRKASAACRTARRVSGVTGMRPSSSKYPMRIFCNSTDEGQRTGTGAADGSPMSGPCITSKTSFKSAIVRAIGPTTPSSAKGPTDCG